MPGIVEPVASSGYFFPTAREGGLRVSHGYPELVLVVDILKKLAELLENGRFPCTAPVTSKRYEYAPLYDAVGGLEKLRREAVRKHIFDEEE